MVAEISVCLKVNNCDKQLEAAVKFYESVCENRTTGCSYNKTIECLLDLQYNAWFVGQLAEKYPVIPDVPLLPPPADSKFL